MTRGRNETSGSLEAYRSSAERWHRMAEEEQARARKAEDRVAELEAALRELRNAVDAADFDALVEAEDGRVDRALNAASLRLNGYAPDSVSVAEPLKMSREKPCEMTAPVGSVDLGYEPLEHMDLGALDGSRTSDPHKAPPLTFEINLPRPNEARPGGGSRYTYPFADILPINEEDHRVVDRLMAESAKAKGEKRLLRTKYRQCPDCNAYCDCPRTTESRYPLASEQVSPGVHEIALSELERVAEIHRHDPTLVRTCNSCGSQAVSMAEIKSLQKYIDQQVSRRMTETFSPRSATALPSPEQLATWLDEYARDAVMFGPLAANDLGNIAALLRHTSTLTGSTAK